MYMYVYIANEEPFFQFYDNLYIKKKQLIICINLVASDNHFLCVLFVLHKSYYFF